MITAFGGELIGANGAPIPLSPGVVTGCGLIMLSGQLALRKGKIIGDTIEQQTEVVIDNIAALLSPLGRGLTDVVKVTAWITDAGDFPGFNAVYANRFKAPFPVRSTVVSELLIAGALVEIEAMVVAA